MIPKVLQLHWFWNDWPAFGDQVVAEWTKMLPGWRILMLKDIPEDFPSDLRPFLDEPRIPPANRGDLIRNFTMWKYGGIYVDFDTRPIRPFDAGLLAHKCFLPICNRSEEGAAAGKGWIDSCIIGSEPGHPFWLSVLENCRRPASWKFPPQWFCGFNTFEGYQTRTDVVALPGLLQEVPDCLKVWEFATGNDTRPATGSGYLMHYRANKVLADVYGWQNHHLAKSWKELYGTEPPEHI